MGLWHQRVFSGINFLPTWDQFSPLQYSEKFGFNHKDKIKSKINLSENRDCGEL